MRATLVTVLLCTCLTRTSSADELAPVRIGESHVAFAAKVSGLNPCDKDDDDGAGQCVGDRVLAQLDLDSMKVFSIFIFGFTCHQNMFTIVNELHRVSIARCNQVIGYAICTALAVYLVIANSGYATYGSEVQSNILQSYPKVPIVSVARVFVSLLVCFTYPLQCNPARRCVLTLLAALFKDEDKAPEELEQVQLLRFTVVTTVFLGLSFLIALSVDDLGAVLSVVGATGSTLVSYILSGFCYFFLFREEGPVWKRYLALLQGCVGLCLIPICLTFIFFGG
jgi:amino acid permease